MLKSNIEPIKKKFFLIHPVGLFRAAVPSGASTGIYEAVELRDGGNTFMGKGKC